MIQKILIKVSPKLKIKNLNMKKKNLKKVYNKLMEINIIVSKVIQQILSVKINKDINHHNYQKNKPLIKIKFFNKNLIILKIKFKNHNQHTLNKIKRNSNKFLTNNS